MANIAALKAHQTLLQWTRQKQSQKNTKHIKVTLNQTNLNYHRIQLPKLYTIQGKSYNKPPMQTMRRRK